MVYDRLERATQHRDVRPRGRPASSDDSDTLDQLDGAMKRLRESVADMQDAVSEYSDALDEFDDAVASLVGHDGYATAYRCINCLCSDLGLREVA